MHKQSNKRSYSLDTKGHKENIFTSKMATENFKNRKLKNSRVQVHKGKEVNTHLLASKKDKIEKYLAKQIITEQNYEKKKKNL